MHGRSSLREEAPGRNAWPDFIAAMAGSAAALVALGLAVTTTVDPYWIVRAEPPWLRWTGGVNRHLDVEMRRAKPLQLFGRPASSVLIGSSVVYRGIRPSDMADGPAFNLGLSAMTAQELPVAAGLAAERPGVRRVVIGLDYFMFSGFRGPPPLDPGLVEGGRRALARLQAALSLRALAGSRPGAIADATEPGEWRADGFKSTPDYPPAVTRRIAAEQDFAAMPYRPETLAFLAAALDRLRDRDVRVYLTPLNKAQLALASRAGREREIARWREDVARLAAQRGVACHDLVTSHPFPDFDPDRGSSDFWLDNVHFKPALGRWLLRRLGLDAPAR